ncbi:MAG: hypothetical protein K6C32_03780 [Bacilli bacterium]|nr:hypothetical protein [Bacilli bacterium]
MKERKTNIIILGLSSLLILTACGGSSAKKGVYTYRTYLSTKPKTWNVHTWETSDESYVPAFTEIGLYDLAFNDTRDGYKVIHEMAGDFPVDVTAEIDDEAILDRYGYTGNIDEGYVWDIALNPNAVWENGEPITADTYVESMKRQLDPKMVNYRADSYYASSLVLANAERYFKQGRSTIEPLYNYIDTDTGDYNRSGVAENGILYINIHAGSPYAGSIFSGTDGSEGLYVVLNNRGTTGSNKLELAAQRINDACQYYCWKYASHEGDYATDWEEITGISKLSSVKSEMMDVNISLFDFDDKEVYVRSTKDEFTEETKERYSQDKLKADLYTVVSGLGRGGFTSEEWSWKLPLFATVYNDYKEDFANVGIAKVNDYKIRLYLSKPIDVLNLEFALTGNWIVDVELYDKLKNVTSTGYVTTKYATPGGGVKGYRSYGPYKLTVFESGKQIKMTRNDKWYGYTDGEHVGQFQTTDIYTRIITDHNVAMQEFEAGRLDDIDLNRADMKVYGNSTRKTSSYESYTQKISFNSNRKKLLDRQKKLTEAGNKTVLSNLNFRKGLSLAMDRNNFASQATAGSKAFTGLLNDLYLTDVTTGEMYRNTVQGKSVYEQVYGKLGGDPYASDYVEQALAESANGYNLAMATKYIVDGLTEEMNSTADGHINKDDTIRLEFRVYDTESETTIEMLNFIRAQFNKVIAEANKKLDANFAITINAQKDEDFYNSAKSGNYDMIFSTWGGAATNPVGLMEVYCKYDFESCCEYGFKGLQDNVNLSIDANGDGEIAASETKSFHKWWTEINNMTEKREAADYEEKHNYRLNVLAGLEAGVLNRFEAVPLVARATTSLNSFKIENGSKVYINLMGYGGIRYLTYNFDDYDWNSFVKSKDYSADLYK